MDIIAAKLGASMAKSELAKSGQIGYIGKKKQVVFPQTTLNFEELYDPVLGLLGEFRLDTPIPLVVGEEYTAVFDGTEYKCVSSGDFGACLGNKSIWSGSDDTGEPFYYHHFEGLEQIIYSRTPGNHTIEIYIEEEEVVTIDPKFLPEVGGGDNGGGGLPVVELTTKLDNGVTLTEEESAALSAVYDSEIPVAVVKAKFVWGASWTWDTAFVVEKGLLTEGAELLIAQVGSRNNANYRVEFDRTYSTGLWSVTVKEIKSDSLPVVDVYRLNGTLNEETSAKLTAAQATKLPVVLNIEKFYDMIYDDWVSESFIARNMYGANMLIVKIDESTYKLTKQSSGLWSCEVS